MYTTSLFVSFHMAPMPLAPCHVQPTTNTFWSFHLHRSNANKSHVEMPCLEVHFSCYPHCSHYFANCDILVDRIRRKSTKNFPGHSYRYISIFDNFETIRGLEKKNSWSNHVICSLEHRRQHWPPRLHNRRCRKHYLLSIDKWYF